MNGVVQLFYFTYFTYITLKFIDLETYSWQGIYVIRPNFCQQPKITVSALSRLAIRFLIRRRDLTIRTRFEASLKAATHVAISILVVFSFTSTVPQWSSGVKQRLSFVAVVDLQRCLLYLQPSRATANPNLMSRCSLSFLHRPSVSLVLFLPRDRCTFVYLVYLSSQLVKRAPLLMVLEISLHRFRMFLCRGMLLLSCLL